MQLKRRLIRSIGRAAAQRGYVLTPTWELGSRPLALHLRRLFERYGVDCVFDVGANRGQYHDFLRDQVEFAGRIVSFEPVSRYAAHLAERSTSDARWTVLDFALGNAKSEAEINVTSSPGLNSFLEPRTDQVDGFWDTVGITREVVRIERLDDVFDGLRERLGFETPYLKLDTQGFDLNVIEGARANLARFVALQTEASIRPIYQDMPDYRRTIDTLNAAGFELSDTFAVTHDDALRLVEFDCVMVRQPPRAA